MTSSKPQSDKPNLDFEVRHCICPVHGEPFRSQWPKGYGVVLREFLLFIEKVDLSGETGGDFTKVPQALLAIPMCCRLPRAHMMNIYLESGIARLDTCYVCQKPGLGTPFNAITTTGQPTTYNHVCFDCVLDKMRRVGGEE